MHVALYVRFRVVDYLMGVFRDESLEGMKLIGEYGRSWFYVALDLRDQISAPTLWDDLHSRFTMPLKQSHDDGLADRSALRQLAFTANLADLGLIVHQ